MIFIVMGTIILLMLWTSTSGLESYLRAKATYWKAQAALVKAQTSKTYVAQIVNTGIDTRLDESDKK